MKYTKFIFFVIGLVRNYICRFDMKHNSLYLGRNDGELIIFYFDNLYFKVHLILLIMMLLLLFFN